MSMCSIRWLFTEEGEREISIKDICSSLKESFVTDKIIEMTENEFIHYQSHLIGHVESVTMHRRRKGMWGGRPRTNKYHIEKIKTSKEEGKFRRVNVLWWLTRKIKVSSDTHPTLMDCEFRSNAWDDVSHKLNVTNNLISSFISFFWCLFSSLVFLGEGNWGRW